MYNRGSLGLTLCAASDATYETGLRVALFSALETLSAPATIIVFDAGLTDPAMWRCMLSAHPRCARCHIIAADVDLLGSYPGQHRFGPAAWVRLFLADLLPDVERLIYIDADVMVRTDLGALWAEPTNSAAIAAVREVKHPTFATGLPHAVSALSIPPETPYFNTGVLLMDLGAWRRGDLTRRAVDYIRDYGDTIRFADQDPINAIAAGHVHELEPRWNVQVSADNTRSTLGRYDSRRGPEFRVNALRDQAAIIHFNGYKPWQPEGIQASAWSIGLHIDFARIAVKFSDRSKLERVCAGCMWTMRLLRRCARALRRRSHAFMTS